MQVSKCECEYPCTQHCVEYKDIHIHISFPVYHIRGKIAEC